MVYRNAHWLDHDARAKSGSCRSLIALAIAYIRSPKLVLPRERLLSESINHSGPVDIERVWDGNRELPISEFVGPSWPRTRPAGTVITEDRGVDDADDHHGNHRASSDNGSTGQAEGEGAEAGLGACWTITGKTNLCTATGTAVEEDAEDERTHDSADDVPEPTHAVEQALVHGGGLLDCLSELVEVERGSGIGIHNVLLDVLECSLGGVHLWLGSGRRHCRSAAAYGRVGLSVCTDELQDSPRNNDRTRRTVLPHRHLGDHPAKGENGVKRTGIDSPEQHSPIARHVAVVRPARRDRGRS